MQASTAKRAPQPCLNLVVCLNFHVKFPRVQTGAKFTRVANSTHLNSSRFCKFAA
nr:hypothetical protein [uncultured Campylobacter sp.]